jgi:hypothetical protein
LRLSGRQCSQCEMPHMSLRNKCAVGGALRFIYQATPLSLELQVNATSRGVDVNAFLRGGKRYNHTSLIRHRGGFSSTANSYAARPCSTHVVMTIEILKVLQIVNLAVSGSACNPNLAYRQSFYLNRIVFAFIGQRPRPPAKSDPGCEGSSAKPQSCVGFPFVASGGGESRRYA